MLGDSVTARQALQRAGQDGDPEMRNIEILEKLKTDTNNAYNTKDFRKVWKNRLLVYIFFNFDKNTPKNNYNIDN